MKALRLLLALCLCTLAPLAGGEPAFKIGDRPPPLEPMAWVKGAPVKSFEPGRVYVVKFFASWCGASNEGMEMMSERARRHAGEVTFIGVNVREAERAEPSVEALTRFVERKGRDLDYIVAMDDPQKKTLFDSWMLAAGSYSIPTAFIIGRDGRLAYLGVPIDYEAQYTFDRALEEALAQKSDLEAARKLQAEMSELTAMRFEEMKVMKPLREALERKDYAAAVTAADEIAASEPKYAPRVFHDKLVSLLHLDEARALGLAQQHAEDAERRKAMGAASAIEFWGRVAGVIAREPDLSRGIYARAAQDLRKWLAEDDDAVSWLHLASIEHRLGNLREAVAAQKRAIAAVDESDRLSRDALERIRSQLEQYEREAAQAETPVPVAGVTRVKSLGGIHEYRLDSNGLSILLIPEHSAPVALLNVTYRVGSRNEVTGTTGATHLLEHLMFKGTDKFNRPAGTSLDQYLERVGARFNATTSLDRTNYFATLGKQDLEHYTAIEADRVRNLWLHEADRRAEMTVVRNELERSQNNPNAVLMQEVTAAAYQALPYHHPVIGWRTDIENVPIEKLRAFYDTFYWPNNATVTLAGDLDPAEALGMIKKYFGNHPRSPQAIPSIYTQEPEQSGARRVTVKRPGELGSVIIAHKIPASRDPDRAALAVLDSVLSSGRSSRLYQRLVNSGMALDADAGAGASHDLALHVLSASLAPGVAHSDVEAAMLAEVRKVKDAGVTEAEVRRVKQQYLAEQDYQRDGIGGVAFELNEWIAAGDWTLYVTLPEAVSRVTAADVQRVAQLYFDEDKSTTGWFVPVNDAAAPATAQSSSNR